MDSLVMQSISRRTERDLSCAFAIRAGKKRLVNPDLRNRVLSMRFTAGFDHHGTNLALPHQGLNRLENMVKMRMAFR